MPVDVFTKLHFFISKHSLVVRKKKQISQMQSAKEKLSSMASAAKEHADISKAEVEEKAEKAAARTKAEKDIAHERKEAKEAQANMELHQAKAQHAADKFNAKHGYTEPTAAPVAGAQAHHEHQRVGTAAPSGGATFPTYPLGGHPPGHKHT